VETVKKKPAIRFSTHKTYDRDDGSRTPQAKKKALERKNQQKMKWQ